MSRTNAQTPRVYQKELKKSKGYCGKVSKNVGEMSPTRMLRLQSWSNKIKDLLCQLL